MGGAPTYGYRGEKGKEAVRGGEAETLTKEKAEQVGGREEGRRDGGCEGAVDTGGKEP